MVEFSTKEAIVKNFFVTACAGIGLGLLATISGGCDGVPDNAIRICLVEQGSPEAQAQAKLNCGLSDCLKAENTPASVKSCDLKDRYYKILCSNYVPGAVTCELSNLPPDYNGAQVTWPVPNPTIRETIGTDGKKKITASF
jgi:hypothetical protein